MEKTASLKILVRAKMVNACAKESSNLMRMKTLALV